MKWFATSRLLEFHRVERQTASGEWSKQTQNDSTSYQLIDLCGVCDESYYVLGAADGSTAIVEKWAVQHPPAVLSGQYVPLSSRRLPEISKRELLRSSEFGLFRACAADSDGRYLILLSEPAHSLYKLQIATGQISLIATSSALPELASIHSIEIGRHVLEGPKIIGHCATRWSDAGKNLPDMTVILSDPEDDGSFGLPQAIDSDAWNALGYSAPAMWTHLGMPYRCN